MSEDIEVELDVFHTNEELNDDEEVNNNNIEELENVNSKENKPKTTRDAAIDLTKTLLTIFVIIGVFMLLGSNVALILERIEDRGLTQPTELELTTEFQITLNPSDWVIRDDMLTTFFSYFEEVSGYPFSENELLQNYRIQTYFYPHNCTIWTKWATEFRLRNYYWGPSANTSTLDAKLGELPYYEGLIAPLEPADDQLEHSFQKLEHDIHSCGSTKYSRETRVQDIPYQPVIRTCADIHKLFPYIWSTELFNDRIVTETAPAYWYTGVYNGVFDNGVIFKADVTLKYASEEEIAKNDEPVDVYPTGEFSLRVWSTHNGHGPWNQDALDEINGWYKQLVKKFDIGSC